eukprot:1812293-Pyramimonas_sp.AAC.1
MHWGADWEDELEKVSSANISAHVMCWIIHLAFIRNVWVVAEKPKQSLLFRFPCVHYTFEARHIPPPRPPRHPSSSSSSSSCSHSSPRSDSSSSSKAAGADTSFTYLGSFMDDPDIPKP